ncbi:SulP family inorganic anion transporter [Glutamicibacter sp. Je.9.36]|uniref:SulP family inorganic anion transporter n=1 Tax=Glutamicibacter sp. Je.9.36 TaxID=3142837 RepID=UPI003DA99596
MKAESLINREHLSKYLKRFGNRSTVKHDLKAGLVLGVHSVPDGLAAGLLAGVNPVHGLYGYLLGTAGGALATGSVFMSVQVTGAMAVVVSDVPEAHNPENSATVLATLALLTGLVMLGLGLAKLGSMVRFIPTAVLIGFINAVALNIVLGQLDNFTGYESQGENRLSRALDTVLHLGSFNWSACLIGTATILLVLVFERTSLGALSMVIAIIGGSALAALLSWLPFTAPTLQLSAVASVPNSLPAPHLPDLSLVPTLILPALSLALVGLVQGAGISGSIVNPNGRYPDASADFRGQGAANLAASFFQGMPVGGSMSATSLVRAAGAKSALANLVAAAVIATTILTLAGLIGLVAMPALAGLLILVGFRTLKIHDMLMVWRTGAIQSVVIAVTFVLTLVIPLQYSVLTGVGLAIILHTVRQSNRIVIKRWVFKDGSSLPDEERPPAQLAPNDLVILVPYGSLFFAAAPMFQNQLPRIPQRCERTAVIIRLRGKEDLGSTFIRALESYAQELSAAGGILILAGISHRANEQLLATRAISSIGPEHVFVATDRVGEALSTSIKFAQKWQST